VRLSVFEGARRSFDFATSGGESRRPKFRRFAHGETARLDSDEHSTRDGCSDALSLLYRRRRARSLDVCGSSRANEVSIDRLTLRSCLHRLRPEIRRDYPLNLSILISGGKETNQDSLSNGE
jgi:hypothetical protein